MKRVGVFCDVSNLYYSLQNKYSGGKLDYRKYLAYVEELGEVTQAIAYGAQMNAQAHKFIHFLKKLGFTTKWVNPKEYHNEDGEIKRKANCDITLCLDIVDLIERLDLIVLGSADGDFTDLVKWAKVRGVPTMVVASQISQDLKDEAHICVEIPASMIEGYDGTTKDAKR